MKIIIISHSSNKYGAELALLEMVDVLRRHHECVVFVPNYGPLVEELKKINIKVKILKYKWWIHFKNDTYLKIFIKFLINLIYSALVAYKINKQKPDIIFSNTAVINTGMISAIILNKPHVWFIHESIKDDPDMNYDISEKIVMKLINKYSDSIIVVSKTLFEKYSKFFDLNKLKLIYLQNIKKPSLNESPLWPIESNENFLKLIIIGTINKNKNQILGIEAINKLKNSNLKKIQLLIIGDGDKKYLKKILNVIKKYGLDGQISFLNYTDNIYPFIMKSDCLLMLSNFESFSRAAIEGMFCGKLVITSDNSGGTSETIKDKNTGLIYKNGSVSDLVLKISYAYNNRISIKEIGENAKKFSQKFHNPDKYLNELDQLIKEVIEKKHA